MLASERSRFILSLLNKDGIINLKDVAKSLGISEATVRRDFEKLEKEGRLVRVTGGAKLSDMDDPVNLVELTSISKQDVNSDKKLKVAQYACELIAEGDCVYIDGGSSTAAMAKFLENMPIRIVTNSELLVRSMSHPTAEIILVGGTYLPHYSMTVGILAQQMVGQFHFNKSFISCTGVDLATDNTFVNEIDTMTVKRLAMDNSDANYLIMDTGKLNHRNFYKFSSVSSFDKVICDNAVSGEIPENFVLV